MKVWIVCSKAFYPRIAKIKLQLESMGHEVILPNSYDNPNAEQKAYDLGEKAHQAFKAEMFRISHQLVKEADAMLVLNFIKHGAKNYIGGATFIEVYEAFMAGKKIYFMNDIPKGILYDELHGFAPVVIHEDLSKI